MGKVFKFLGLFLLLIAIGSVAFWYLGRDYIEGEIKDRISQSGQAHLQDFSLNKVTLTSLFPLQISLQGIQFKMAGIEVNPITSLNIFAELEKPFWETQGNSLKVKMEVEDVQIQKVLSLEAFLSNSTAKKEPEGPATGFKISELGFLFVPLLSLPWPIQFEFFLNSANFKVLGPDQRVLVELAGFQMSAQQTPFMNPKSPLSLNLKTQLQSDWLGLSYKLPIQISTKESYFENNRFSAKNLDLSLGGIQTSFKEGFSDLSTNEHHWNSQFSIKDLSQLPQLPDFLPAGKWQGSIEGKLEFKKQPNQPPFVGVQLKTSPIQGQVQVEKGQFKLAGKVDTQFQTQFSYTQQLKLENFIGFLDLTNTKIQEGSIFDKAEGVPLRADMNVVFSSGLLNVNKMNVVFDRLNLLMSGKLSQDNKNQSDLKVQIPEVNLQGFEKYIPFLSSSPMNGQLGGVALVQGNISQLSELVLKMEDFHLKKFSTFIDYKQSEKEFSIRGPFQMDAEGNLIFENMYIKNANLKFNANGDNLDFKLGNNMSKKAGSQLRVSANILQQQNKMTLKQTLIKSPGIDLEASGQIFNEDLTKFDIETKLNEFNKAELEKVLPSLSQFEPQPIARGNLKIKGALDPKVSLQNMPFDISGGLFIKVPVYKTSFFPRKTASGENPIQGEGVAPTAYLPDWPMFRKANLQIRAYFDHFYADEFHLTNVNANAYLNGGILNLKGQVDGAYGGKIFIDSLKFDALKPAPETLVSFRVENMQTAKAFKDLIPGYSGEANGSMNLNFRGKIPYPHGRGWHDELLAKGELEFRRTQFANFKFDQLASQAIMNAQGVGNQQEVQYSGKNYNVKAQISVAKNRLLLSDLNMLSEEGGQFIVNNGYIDVDLNCNFFGDVYLTKAPIRGAVFVANRDNKMRFTAPMIIKGSFLSPVASFSREALDQMLSNAIRYEANKTQMQSRKALEEAALKNKQELNSKTKKKIDSLFEIK